MFRKVTAAAALVIVASVSLTGCSNAGEQQEKKAVANTYESFVGGIFDIPEDNITSAYQSVVNEIGSTDMKQVTETQKKDAISTFQSLAPDTFKLVDMPDLNITEQGQVVVGSVATAAKVEGADVTVAVPIDAIEVNGDTATIDIAKVKVNYTQGTSSVKRPNYTESQLEKYGDIQLKKKNNDWLITSHDNLLAEIIH